MNKAWILVADAARARLFSAPRPGGPLTPTREFQHDAARRSGREVNTDTMGRVHDRTGTSRHALEPETQHKTTESRRFARLLADYLEQKHREGEFDCLALIAAPAFLGELRSALGKWATPDVIVAEIPKDLVHSEEAQIRATLS
jgi:protein required for attachment to host cells